MRTILIIFIALISCQTSEDRNCKELVEQKNYNLSICLKNDWYVDSSNPNELILGDKKTQVLIKFRTWKDDINNSSQDLWIQSYKNTYSEDKNWTLTKEKKIERDNVDIYVAIHRLGEEVGGTHMIALTGVMKSREKVCHIQCPYVERIKGAESFALDAIESLRFLNETD